MSPDARVSMLERMTPPRGPSGAPMRRFVLDRPTAEGRPALLPEDERHALKVLRLDAGDRLIGLDGSGHVWPLIVTSAGRSRLELECTGRPEKLPPPGSPGSPVPRIELAFPLPRGARAEECVDRLTQLGVAALQPIVLERSPPHGRTLKDTRRARLERSVREASKQSGNPWFLEIAAPTSLAGLLSRVEGPLVWLDPGGEEGLATWSTREEPGAVTVVAGPEGGLTADEERALRDAGAVRLRLGVHILRIETAAEAAAAVLVSG